MSGCPTMDSLQASGSDVAAHVAICPACQSIVSLMDPDVDDPSDCARAELLIAAGASRPLARRDASFLPAHLARCSACRQIALEPGAGAGLELPRVERDTYVLGAEIGRGGMGRILSAYDRRIGRTVALKEMLSSEPMALARFEREARITARLQHPGIVSIYEVGRWPDDRPFYAMPILPGRTLREAIAAAPGLDGRLALIPAVIAAAEAVAYAHSRRIIHRDLTPANILLGSFGETIVIDWGVAKDLDADAGDPGNGEGDERAAGLTVHGTVVGTVAYIPPEQADGAPVDERADVYALGAILHHVLTGHHPYHGQDASTVLTRLRGREAPPLVAEGPVPRDLVAIVRRAMAVDPGQRYRTAMALVEDLRRYLGDGRTSLDYLTFALAAVRRRRRWAAAAFTLTLAMTAVVFWTLPRTYHVEMRLEEPELPPLGEEVTRERPQWSLPLTPMAIEEVRSRENLAGLAAKNQLLAGREAARSPLERLLDWLGRRVGTPPGENERTMRLVDELERHTGVDDVSTSYGDRWLDISVDWPEPRAAYRVAAALQESFLQARQMVELDSLAEALSVLIGREKNLRQEIEEAVRAIDDRERGRRAVAAKAPSVVADHAATEQLTALWSYKKMTLEAVEASRQLRIKDMQARHSLNPVLESSESLAVLQHESPMMLDLRQEVESLRQQLARRPAGPSNSPADTGSLSDPARSQALTRAGAPSSGDDPDLTTARERLRVQVVAYTTLVQRLDQARMKFETTRAAFKYHYRVERPALVPRAPASPQLADALRFGLGLAVVLAALVAVAADRRARRRGA